MKRNYNGKKLFVFLFCTFTVITSWGQSIPILSYKNGADPLNTNNIKTHNSNLKSGESITFITSFRIESMSFGVVTNPVSCKTCIDDNGWESEVREGSGYTVIKNPPNPPQRVPAPTEFNWEDMSVLVYSYTIPIPPEWNGCNNIELKFWASAGNHLGYGENNVAVYINLSAHKFPSFSPSSISATSSSVCSGTSTTLSVSGGSLGTGASWEWYSGSLGGTPIDSGSSILVSPTSPTTYYVRAEKGCNPTSAVSTTITVKEPLSITSHPSTSIPSVKCKDSGSFPQLSVSTNGTDIRYQWYRTTSASYIDGTDIYGATNSNYYPPSNLPADDYWYYCIVSSSDCGSSKPSNFSGRHSITTITQPNSTPTPQESSICYGGTTSISLGAASGGLGTITYEWQSSTNGINWSPISNSNSQNYTTQALQTNTYFRRQAKDSQCGDALPSQTVLIQVAPEFTQPATSIASSNLICYGKTSTISLGAASGGLGTITYEWQSSTNGTNWSPIPNSNSQNYTTPALQTNTYFRRQAQRATCGNPIFSDAVLVEVRPEFTQPEPITPITICSGKSNIINLGVATGGSGKYNYKWECQNIATNRWYELLWYMANDTTVLAYPLPASSSQDIIPFRRVVTDAMCGIDTSQTILITVNPYSDSTMVEIDGNQILCPGETAELQVSTNDVINPIFNWYANDTDVVPFYTGNTYTTSVLVQDSTFFVTLQGDNYCENLRDRKNVTVTVNQLPQKPVTENRTILTTEDFPIIITSGSIIPDSHTLYWHIDTTKVGTKGTDYTHEDAIAGDYTYYVRQQSKETSCWSNFAEIIVSVVEPEPTCPAPTNVREMSSSLGITFDSNIGRYEAAFFVEGCNDPNEDSCYEPFGSAQIRYLDSSNEIRFTNDAMPGSTKVRIRAICDDGSTSTWTEKSYLKSAEFSEWAYITVPFKIIGISVKIKEINTEKITVYPVAIGVAIQTQELTTVSIYNMFGQEVHQSTISGDAEIALNKGIYIVQANNETFKVIVQ